MISALRVALILQVRFLTQLAMVVYLRCHKSILGLEVRGRCASRDRRSLWKRPIWLST